MNVNAWLRTMAKLLSFLDQRETDRGEEGPERDRGEEGQRAPELMPICTRDASHR